jgi:hypothetical protein
MSSLMGYKTAISVPAHSILMQHMTSLLVVHNLPYNGSTDTHYLVAVLKIQSIINNVWVMKLVGHI